MADYKINIGGDVTKSSIAVGPGARAGDSISGGSAKEDVSRLLDAFIVALGRYGNEEAVVSDMRTLAESARREADMQRPDKGRIESLLDRIKTLLSTASSVVVPVAELTSEIERIWSAAGHL